MRRLRLLLLLLGPLQGFLSQTIHVTQIPVIFAEEGGSVTIPCEYNISEQDATIGSYKWYKHSNHSKMEIFSTRNNESTGRISRADTDEFINERSAAIVLHRVGSSDSGMYYCEVSFQIGSDVSSCGDGTFLNVTGSMDELWQENECNCSNDSQKSQKIYILLKVVGLVAILLTALVGYLCAKNRGPLRCDPPIVRPSELTRKCPHGRKTSRTFHIISDMAELPKYQPAPIHV